MDIFLEDIFNNIDANNFIFSYDWFIVYDIQFNFINT